MGTFLSCLLLYYLLPVRNSKELCCTLSLVEVSGIEPLTSCMPCKRSPS
jgi:hypothetical protein